MKDHPPYDKIYQTGKLKNLMENISFSSKERIIFPRTISFDETLLETTMIIILQDTQENYKPLTQSRNIIGGLGCKASSRIMSRAVAFANNLRLTETPRNQLSDQLKELKQLDLLPIAQSTSHRSMITTLSWSW